MTKKKLNPMKRGKKPSLLPKVKRAYAKPTFATQASVERIINILEAIGDEALSVLHLSARMGLDRWKVQKYVIYMTETGFLNSVGENKTRRLYTRTGKIMPPFKGPNDEELPQIRFAPHIQPYQDAWLFALHKPCIDQVRINLG